MTKIKNTKKGMAKKTLSMSLVVAMLATSNVPVWAAEFSDGSDAAEVTTEAPAVEDTTAEEAFTDDAAPVVDDTEATTEAATSDPTVDSKYVVEFKNLPSSMTWNEEKEVEIRVFDKVQDKYVTNNADIQVRYLDEDGQLVGNNGNAISFTTAAPTEDGYAKFKINFLPWVTADKTLVGKKFRLQVFNTKDPNETGYANASDTIEVKKVKANGTVNITGANPTVAAKWNQVTYTGKAITAGPELVAGTGLWEAGIDFGGAISGTSGLGLSGTLSKDCVIEGQDVVNAWNYSKKTLTSTVDINDPLYEGKVKITFAIEPKVLTDDNFEDNIKITLPEYTYEYTGNRIEIPSASATVTDLNSGAVITNALDSAKSSTIWVSQNTTAVGVYNDDDKDSSTYINAWVINPENAVSTSTLKNYVIANGTNLLRRVSGAVTVNKRDLTNAATTEIKFKPVNNETLVNGAFINADALKDGNLVIKDVKTGADLTAALKDKVKVTLASNPLSVETGSSYTATVEAVDTDSLSGKRDVTFKVIAHDLSQATVANETKLEESVKYTGSQITKNITKDNFESKLGVVKYQYSKGQDTVLAKDKEYSSTPEFGENLNVGKGQIIINGVGTFEDTQKVIEFNIVVRDADTLNVPESVDYNEAYATAADYGLASQTTVTSTFKDEWTGEKKTLTVPASDYTIAYSYEDENHNTVSGPVKGGYIVTTVTPKANVKSNFTFTSFTEKTKLAKKAIKEEDVTLNKDSYVYTGKEIALDYTVKHDGETLVKGTDYDVAVVNGTNVGEGTLVITGKGEYEDSAVRVKFTITPAKTTDVKVTPKSDVVYDGKQHNLSKDELNITLNGVDVSADFKVSYSKSKTANINAGDAEVILTPANKNFDNEATAKFTIKQATLSGGTLNAYNAKESLVKWFTEGSDQDSEFRFTYDGTAKTYTKTVYKPATQSDSKVVTADDYEIRYVDNVSGKGGIKSGRAHVLVIAKGNYTATGTYTCEDGTKIQNVVLDQMFLIDRLDIHKSGVTVENGAYKGGFNVDPVVTINFNGKKLVAGTDFELDYTGYTTQDRTEVTNGKTLSVKLKAKGGYYLADDVKNEVFKWGIDKFDLANAEVVVTGTDANPVVKVMNGSVVVSKDEYTETAADGKLTITAKDSSKNYTGTQTVDIKHELEKPAAPMISDVKVVGNKATVILSGEAEGAAGYDYVISTDRDCITNKDYDSISKNQVRTSTNFKYVQQGVYYAYCHAWKRDENGKKVFSDWSNAYPFSVTAITPDAPVITNVTVSGSTIKVTYKAAANATGYDVVLGTSSKKENGETRPYNYGAHKVLNLKEGTVTATFKNVPAGKWTVGMHAFNRTSEDGKKVFSPWSNLKTATVK